jgi:hypothetical protein
MENNNTKSKMRTNKLIITKADKGKTLIIHKKSINKRQKHISHGSIVGIATGYGLDN